MANSRSITMIANELIPLLSQFESAIRKFDKENQNSETYTKLSIFESQHCHNFHSFKNHAIGILSHLQSDLKDIIAETPVDASEFEKIDIETSKEVAVKHMPDKIKNLSAHLVEFKNDITEEKIEEKTNILCEKALSLLEELNNQIDCIRQPSKM